MCPLFELLWYKGQILIMTGNSYILFKFNNKHALESLTLTTANAMNNFNVRYLLMNCILIEQLIDVQ